MACTSSSFAGLATERLNVRALPVSRTAKRTNLTRGRRGLKGPRAGTACTRAAGRRPHQTAGRNGDGSADGVGHSTAGVSGRRAAPCERRGGRGGRSPGRGRAEGALGAPRRGVRREEQLG